MFYLILLLCVGLLSWTNVHLTAAIDYSLDYGNILSPYRHRRFKRADPGAIGSAEEQINQLPSEHRANSMNAAYWAVYEAQNKLWLKGIICITCMTIRINTFVILFLLVGAILFAPSILYIFTIPFYLIFSFGLNYYFHDLLQ